MQEMTDMEDVTEMKRLTWRSLTPRQRRAALRYPISSWRHTRAVNAVYDENKVERMTPQVAKALESYLMRPLTWKDLGAWIVVTAIVLAPWAVLALIVMRVRA